MHETARVRDVGWTDKMAKCSTSDRCTKLRGLEMLDGLTKWLNVARVTDARNCEG